jgi:hypothetical protein
MPDMEKSPQRDQPPNYRRYHILGLLPALVILTGGLYLGVAEGNWIPLLAGLLFLIVCIGMIAFDRKGRPSNRSMS